MLGRWAGELRCQLPGLCSLDAWAAGAFSSQEEGQERPLGSSLRDCNASMHLLPTTSVLHQRTEEWNP